MQGCGASLNTFVHQRDMRHHHIHHRNALLIIPLSVLLLMIPPMQGFPQEYVDTPPTLSVSLNEGSIFVYRDSEGHAVVVGMAYNNDQMAFVSNVSIRVNFYDEQSPEPIETLIGGTILDVIASNSKSPFAIRSHTTNAGISQASVAVLGFESSVQKETGITVRPDNISLDGATLRLSGMLQNGAAPSTDTKVHIALYDGFEPARIVGVHSIDIGQIAPNIEAAFEFNQVIDSRVVGILLFAESDVFYSDFVGMQIPPSQALIKMVTITDVAVRDVMGNSLTEVPLGSSINIRSSASIQMQANGNDYVETPYTFYVQIKEFGQTPYTEFIGKYQGRFVGTEPQVHAIDWIPESPGQYFIETFVWDRNNVPLAEKGPIALISVR